MNIFNFRREWLESLTFCSKFYENQWIGFVDKALFVFLFLSDYGGRHFVNLVT